MQYLLMIYSDQSRIAAMAPEEGQKMMAAFNAYTESLKAAGAWLAGDRLKPTTEGATVRVRDGQTQVLDGPYADTKEQLGGYYMIEAADLDEAVKWAARCPGAQVGILEVRPIWPMG